MYVQETCKYRKNSTQYIKLKSIFWDIKLTIKSNDEESWQIEYFRLLG